MKKENLINTVGDISREEFYLNYVNQNKPVLIKETTKKWDALTKWDASYFKKIENGLKIPIKKGNIAEGKRDLMTLSDYTHLLDDYETRLKNGENPTKPPYLHDVPLFYLLPHLVKDISPFPIKYFPNWYWDKWWNYAQFFMGGTGSLTPLHFDTLYTHNLFFQVAGYKKFVLVPADFQKKCYLYNWRWSKVNPQMPNPSLYPVFEGVEFTEVIIGPGDILYMPPGMLHQVQGLSHSISFNIDWHTKTSVGKGMYSLFRGAPLKNIYYNSLILSGLFLKIPSRFVFPFYKSYLNYVS